MNYAEWITAYHRRIGGPAHTYGKCREAVHEMKKAFPELEIKKGHVYCPEPWGKRGHWWLLDPDGRIIDPTAAQFDRGIFEYEEYKEGDPVRLGSCANCGDSIWGPPESGHPTVCSEECHEAYAAYIMGSL